MQIDKFLSVFRRELIQFAGDNVTLAGGLIDELHGQKIHYSATVLNMIIFNPTTQQIAKVKVEFENDMYAKPETFDGSTGWTVTDIDTGLIINIIFKEKPIPENLMLFAVEKPYYSADSKAVLQEGIFYKCLPINS